MRSDPLVVTAGATGDGPADQEDCDYYADNMNTAIDSLKKAFADGNSVAAERAQDYLEEAEDVAMDEGCFVVYD